MKLTVPILLMLCGSAAAERITLAPVPAAKAAPRVVGSQAVCKDDNDFLRVMLTKLEGHEVEILRDCKNAHTHLAFETASGWNIFATVASSGSTSFATLKKKRVLLHREDTVISDEKTTSHVDLCRYTKDGVECGSVEVECPDTGCKDPQILKGALWLHAKGGRKRFAIE